MSTVAVYNVKGGVGKSVVALHLSLAMRAAGTQAVHVEGDTEAPMSKLPDCLPDAVPLDTWLEKPANGPTVIDLGPGCSANHSLALSKADLVILVTTAEPASLLGTIRAARQCLGQNSQAEFALVVNDVTNKASGRKIAARLTAAFLKHLSQDISFFVVIPHNEAIAEATSRRQSLSEYKPKSKALIDFATLAAAVGAWQKNQGKPELLTSWRLPTSGQTAKAA